MSMRAALLAVAVLSLAACGGSPRERGVSGAAIGAGLGAATAGVTDGSVVGGALVGAAAGAAVGLLTDRGEIDLGDFLDLDD